MKASIAHLSKSLSIPREPVRTPDSIWSAAHSKSLGPSSRPERLSNSPRHGDVAVGGVPSDLPRPVSIQAASSHAVPLQHVSLLSAQLKMAHDLVKSRGEESRPTDTIKKSPGSILIDRNANLVPNEAGGTPPTARNPFGSSPIPILRPQSYEFDVFQERRHVLRLAKQHGWSVASRMAAGLLIPKPLSPQLTRHDARPGSMTDEPSSVSTSRSDKDGLMFQMDSL